MINKRTYTNILITLAITNIKQNGNDIKRINSTDNSNVYLQVPVQILCNTAAPFVQSFPSRLPGSPLPPLCWNYK